MNALIVNLNLSVDKTVLVPGFETGRIFRLGETLTLPGGKGVNVARALRSLGLKAPIAGFASGHNGRWIVSRLRKEGFRPLVQMHKRGESRVCYTIADSRGVTTDLNEEGPAVPLNAQSAFLRRFSEKISGLGAVAVCGRTSAGLKKDFYASIVRRARRAGCFCVFDTSGPALAVALGAGADGIKINRHEFEELSGASFSRAAVDKFFARRAPSGLKTLIVTDGPSSAYAASPFGLWRIDPPRLPRLLSAVGAGDSFMAGFLFGFLNNYSFERALGLGAGAAASDCLSLGAGLISRDEALSYASRASVRKVS